MLNSPIEIELPYPPSTGNHSVRHTRNGGHYVTKECKAYRAEVGALVNPRGNRVALAGPLHVDLLLAPPDRRARDVDNLLKVVKDALTLAGVWVDDSNKVIVGGSWQWADPVPGGRVFVTMRGAS